MLKIPCSVPNDIAESIAESIYIGKHLDVKSFLPRYRNQYFMNRSCTSTPGLSALSTFKKAPKLTQGKKL